MNRDPPKSEVDKYDYELPRELIAQQPLANRLDARLLVVDRQAGTLEHFHVRDLPAILDQGDRLVLNNSRVIPARLVGFRTDTGGRWQGLFIEADESGTWRLLGKTRGRLTPGCQITLQDRLARDDVQLKMVLQTEEGHWIAKPASNEPPLRILERIGRVPLPHYIRHGEMLDSDWQDYQTVFSQHPGSIAAPTAGLHFNEQLFQQLTTVGVESCFVTLHVGVGTFRPIVSQFLTDHRMHEEWAEISRETVQTLREARNTSHRIVAVGTTAVRTLEAASEGGELNAWSGKTDLFIRPPYQFHSVDALMTNFHLPRSTLLVLVRAFGGDELIQEAYRAAIKQQYRFFSFGDAMLIL